MTDHERRPDAPTELPEATIPQRCALAQRRVSLAERRARCEQERWRYEQRNASYHHCGHALVGLAAFKESLDRSLDGHVRELCDDVAAELLRALQRIAQHDQGPPPWDES